ncbi:MAG TPA: hypothetical protein PKO38_06940, partial [Bacillota bacterium]|nr:hypothetical protein [Bacillota bacterium]
MREFRWPVIVATAIAALIIFFGALFLYQRHYIEGPFLDSLEQMEGIESVELEQGAEAAVLRVRPEREYRGSLPDLMTALREQAEQEYRKPLEIRLEDWPNEKLLAFRDRVLPALYESARLGNYRSADEAIRQEGEKRGLEDFKFTMDHRFLYLQAR